MRRYIVAVLLLCLVTLTWRRAAAQAAGSANAAPRAMSAAEKQVVANERAIFDVLQKQDWTKFASMVDGITYIDMGGIVPRMQTSQMLDDLKNLVTNSYELSDVRTRVIRPDVILLTYTVAVDQTNKGQHVLSPIHSMSVWQKKGAKW